MPDEVYATGDASGFGEPQHCPRLPASTSRSSFSRLLVPIVQDARGAQDLSLELGYRYSDYNTSGGYNTYKVMASWGISDSWRLRGGYNRAIREPSMIELYDPLVESDSGYGDLCEGENPVASFEECARTGVTAAQYGHIYEWPPEYAGSNVRYGGNPELGPEDGRHLSPPVWFGRRTHIRGLSITLDYYNIEISDAIGTVPAETIHRVCMDDR